MVGMRYFRTSKRQHQKHALVWHLGGGGYFLYFGKVVSRKVDEYM